MSVLSPPTEVHAALRAAALGVGVPYTWLAAVAYAESGYRVDATGPEPVRARGLMQLAPAVADALGIDAYDPTAAARAAAKLLRGWYERERQWTRALACYVWGPGKVRSGAKWPASVERYVARVVATRYVLMDAADPISGTNVERLADGIARLARANPSDLAVQRLAAEFARGGRSLSDYWTRYAAAFDAAVITEGVPAPRWVEPHTVFDRLARARTVAEGVRALRSSYVEGKASTLGSQAAVAVLGGAFAVWWWWGRRR